MSQRQLECKNKKILAIRPSNNFHFPVTALFKQQLAEVQLGEEADVALFGRQRPGTPVLVHGQPLSW